MLIQAQEDPGIQPLSPVDSPFQEPPAQLATPCRKENPFKSKEKGRHINIVHI